MATVKVTFTLDEATITRLRQAAQRLAKPRSQVVREAIHDYSERIGRLSEITHLDVVSELTRESQTPSVEFDFSRDRKRGDK